LPPVLASRRLAQSISSQKPAGDPDDELESIVVTTHLTPQLLLQMYNCPGQGALLYGQ